MPEPQAARPSTITRASSRASNFFMCLPPNNLLFTKQPDAAALAMGCAANSIGGLERTESALHGADRQAGHDVALEEGVGAGDGNDDEHDQNHSQSL